jgi:alanyl-tRNA synthetase
VCSSDLAVFDETYPDPVRVVSIGRQIEDLIADPNGPSAFEHSVEFCGGTHLLNSSHIEKFIILSEEAIAKGVRRIIAVTGAEAQRAHKRADALDKEVKELTVSIQNEIKNNKDTVNLANLNKQIYALNEVINQSQISYWRKGIKKVIFCFNCKNINYFNYFEDALRQDLENIKKSLLELEKASKANLLNKSLEECKEFVLNNPKADRVIKEFKIGGEAKSLNEIMKYLRSSLPEASVMLFSVDEINSKILCLSSVPDVIRIFKN